jgi:hypothetical protein
LVPERRIVVAWGKREAGGCVSHRDSSNLRCPRNGKRTEHLIVPARANRSLETCSPGRPHAPIRQPGYRPTQVAIRASDRLRLHAAGKLRGALSGVFPSCVYACPRVASH